MENACLFAPSTYHSRNEESITKYFVAHTVIRDRCFISFSMTNGNREDIFASALNNHTLVTRADEIKKLPPCTGESYHIYILG